MSTKTRRSIASANVKKEKEAKKEVKEEQQEDDDDGPPPVLEREASCGENDDTDGDAKEEEIESTATSPQELILLEDGDEESESKTGGACENLLQALSHVFSADGDSSPTSKKRTTEISSSRIIPATGSNRGSIPKSLLLNKNVRHTPSSSKLSTPSTRFTSLRQLSSLPGTSSSAGSSTGTRKYGVPPPIPSGLRNFVSTTSPAVGVGSNTSLGPARLLENRKRQMEKDREGTMAKRSSLVAYNGGRAGEKFHKIPSSAGASPAAGSSASSGTSTSSSTTAFDVHSMLRDQSPVRMQVSVGGEHDQFNGNSIQEAIELANNQKETIGNIARAASNHSMLLGSMIINGLNTLESRNTEDYTNFAGELFTLITKYNIH